MKICVGGTFNKLHKGHKKLLDTAFVLGDEVIIGLTSDEYARKKKRRINAYKDRENILKAYCRKKKKGFKIVKIDNAYGPAVKEKTYKGIVVSTETYRNAIKINSEREKRGMKALVIITIPMLKL